MPLIGTGDLSLPEGASEVCGDTMRLALGFFPLVSSSFSLVPGLLCLSRFRLTMSSKYSSLLSLLSSFEVEEGLSFFTHFAANAAGILQPSSESSFFSSSLRSLLGLRESSAFTFLASMGGMWGGGG